MMQLIVKQATWPGNLQVICAKNSRRSRGPVTMECRGVFSVGRVLVLHGARSEEA